MRARWTVAAACALVSCSGPGNDTSPEITFSPSPLRATYWEGDSTGGQVSISYRNISGQVSIRIVDAEGILASGITLEHQPQSATIIVKFSYSTTLAAAVHAGALEISLCRDSPAVCADAVEGSPWRLPYEITVRPGTNLTTLVALPQGRPWSTFQGNAAHDGYVPAPDLLPAQFTRRWTLRTGTIAVATDGGRVFAITVSPWQLRAIDEDTGTAIWSKDLVDVGSPSGTEGIAAAGGRIFVSLWNASHSRQMRIFDQATGDLLATYGSAEGDIATPFEQAVYGYFGAGGGSRIELPALTETWRATCDPYARCIPFGLGAAVDADRVYTQAADGIGVFRRADGVQDFTIVDPSLTTGVNTFDAGGSPVLGSDGNVYVTQLGATVEGGRLGRLVGWDVAGRKLKWKKDDFFRSNPVVAAGTVYVRNGETYTLILDARSAADCSRLWFQRLGSNFTIDYHPWTPPPQVVVVGNLVFVNTIDSVVAFDRTTHAKVWTHPHVGSIAVSERGVLYIATDDALLATNLAFVAQ